MASSQPLGLHDSPQRILTGTRVAVLAAVRLLCSALGTLVAASPTGALAGAGQNVDEEDPPPPPLRSVDIEQEPIGLSGDDKLLSFRFIAIGEEVLPVPMVSYERDLGDVAAIGWGATTFIFASAAYAGVHWGDQTGLMRPYAMARGYLFHVGGWGDDEDEFAGGGSAGFGLQMAFPSHLVLQLELEVLGLYEPDSLILPIKPIPMGSLGLGYAW